jgi:hypothetical protein
MSERSFVVSHKPEVKHWCDDKAMSWEGYNSGWPDYTIVQCEDCGDELYYTGGPRGGYMTDIRWFNRWIVYRKAGLK